MQTNQVPAYDTSVNTTNCCAKFNPLGWDSQDLHFKDKPFLRATTRSVMHIPVNMGRVFSRVFKSMADSHANDPVNVLVLSRDLSGWQAEHLFATNTPIANEEMVTLSGDFITKVFEGPYRKAKDWYAEMQDLVRARSSDPDAVYFFYTTCPKCAAAYGENYVVAVAKI